MDTTTARQSAVPSAGGDSTKGRSRFAGGSVAVEVFLPDVFRKRVLKSGPRAGMTHRKLLPILPRKKLAGSKYLSSSIRLNTPDTRRPALDLGLPELPNGVGRSRQQVVRARSCDPIVSGITGKLNKRMENVHKLVSTGSKLREQGSKEDASYELDGEPKKKKDQTKMVLGEVKDIISHVGQYFEGHVANTVSHNDRVKVKKATKQEEKKKVEEGFQAKGPKALFDHVMGQINYYRKGDQFDSLSGRVAGWLSAPETWAIEKNRKLCSSFEAQKELYASLRHQREHFRNTVHANLERQSHDFEEERTRVSRKMQLNSEKADRLIAGRRQAAARQKAEQVAKVAALCTVIGARASIMFNMMITDRPIRERLKKLTKAARTIQRFVRPIIWRKKGKKIRQGMRKLKNLINEYHVRWGLERTKKAVVVVMTFTQEMQQQSEMKTAIGNYMRHVKRLQRVFRSYSVWKQYVLEVRREQFDDLEATCVDNWHKRKAKIEKELSAASNPDPDAIIGDFNMRRPPHRISEAIREQLLVESFRQDQVGMRPQLAAFGGALEEFRLRLGTWKALVDAQQVVNSSKSMKQIMKDEPPPDRPRRPIIVPRLSEDDLWIMIKKGHARMDELMPEAT